MERSPPIIGQIELAHKSRSEATTINPGDSILLRLPNDELKIFKLDPDSTVNLGKFGSFEADELFGEVYGLTYEVSSDKTLKALPPKTLEEFEDTDATNELINDGSFVQPLTYEEIEALKETGAHVSDIIKKQIEQHANYSLKTEYSKDKYKKRKEAKYSKSFTAIEPTLFNICQYWFTKDPTKIRDIRPDTLAQIMNIANVRPGARFLVVDDVSGLIAAAVLERLGGDGRILTVTDIDSPPAFHIVKQMNFSEDLTSTLIHLNWAAADEDYTPIQPPLLPAGGKFKSEREMVKLTRRKETSDALDSAREELFNGEWDGVIIASQYEPYSILEKLSPYLAGSASIVIYSQYLQVLAEALSKMKQQSTYLAPSITESWLRQYQVLPGRTHPLMTMPGSGGYILQTIRIYDDPKAHSIRTERRAQRRKLAENKKRKRELLELESCGAAADGVGAGSSGSRAESESSVPPPNRKKVAALQDNARTNADDVNMDSTDSGSVLGVRASDEPVQHSNTNGGGSS